MLWTHSLPFVQKKKSGKVGGQLGDEKTNQIPPFFPQPFSLELEDKAVLVNRFLNMSLEKPTYREFLVIGRHAPTETNPDPKLYKMKIFAKNEIGAKSRFWYFVSVQKKVKKASGQILQCSEIFEKHPKTIKNFGVFMRYTSRTGTHNLYKEYRDLTRTGAVKQVYQDLAGSYRARFRNIHIMSVDAVMPSKCRRASTKQFHNARIRFPLPHRVLKVPKELKHTFSRRRPGTHM